MSKLLVFCIDALCASDAAKMRTMPHFAPLFERGALVEKIEPVLPALTYTCHTSILTGTYAGRHGIINNERMSRGGHLNTPWYCMKSEVRGQTLLSDALATSMDEHERFGGVVPEIASRAHLEAMVPTVHKAFSDAGVSADLDLVDECAGVDVAQKPLVPEGLV